MDQFLTDIMDAAARKDGAEGEWPKASFRIVDPERGVGAEPADHTHPQFPRRSHQRPVEVRPVGQVRPRPLRERQANAQEHVQK